MGLEIHPRLKPSVIVRPTGFGGGGLDLPTPTCFWRMNAPAGQNEPDTCGVANLTAVNAPGTVSGKVGQARLFAAASAQYFTTPDQQALRMNAPSTIAGWFNLNTKTADQYLLVKGTGTTNFIRDLYFLYSSGSNYMQFGICDGSGTASFLNAFPNPASLTWHCFCLKWDGTNVYSAVNGGAFNSTPYGLPQGTISPLWLGATPVPSTYLNGLIDALGWWRGTVLTDAQWLNFYNAGAGREYYAGAWT